MALTQVFHREYTDKGWFSSLAMAEGWFGDQFTAGAASGGSCTTLGGGVTFTNAAGVATFVLPAHIGTDGVVLVHTTRSSSGNTAGIADGSGGTFTGFTGTPYVNNASDNNYGWQMPFVAARSGSTVTITWTGANQSAIVWEVVSGTFDAVSTVTSGGSGSTETAAAMTAGGTAGRVYAFGGGRGNADGTQETLNTSTGVPSGYTGARAVSSTAATPNRNAHAWLAYKDFSGSSSIASAAGTLTATVNSRGAYHVTILAYGQTGARRAAARSPRRSPSRQRRTRPSVSAGSRLAWSAPRRRRTRRWH